MGKAVEEKWTMMMAKTISDHLYTIIISHYLYFHRIQESRRASYQRASRHRQLGNGVESPFVEDPRTVANALPARYVFCDCWVVLPSLELLVRVNVRILIVQSYHHADQHQLTYMGGMGEMISVIPEGRGTVHSVHVINIEGLLRSAAW